LFGSNVDHKEFMKCYTDEQMDRQVLWILKKIPELDFENKKLQNHGKVDEKERSLVSFECGKTGFHLSLFFHHLKATLEKVAGKKSIMDLATVLDSNHGCLSFALENELQQNLFKVA
jgi:hypothetical protein